MALDRDLKCPLVWQRPVQRTPEPFCSRSRDQDRFRSARMTNQDYVVDFEL